MAMIPSVKDEWVRRVMDPEAKQGKDILRDENGNQCCLDFLNQMCSDAGYQPQPVQIDQGIYGYEDPEAAPTALEAGYQVTVLTQACIKYAGLSDDDPEVSYGNSKYRLSYLNDYMKLTLAEIGVLIRDDEEI